MKKIKMKNIIKNKNSFGRLFYNDKFLLIFSVFLAFIIWTFNVNSNQETYNWTVTDIPVSIPKLSDDLQIFGADNLTASVRISGNTLVVQSMTSDDVYVTASNVGELTEVGQKTMKLTAQKSGVKTDYEFASTVSPSEVDVYVDKYVSREISITDSVKHSDVDESLYIAQGILSQQTVTIQGPETYVNSIASVCAVENIDEALTQTKTITDVPLVFYDADDNIVKSTYITSNITSVDVTIPVYQVKNISIDPNIVNMPDNLTFDDSLVKVTPSSINLIIQDSSVDADNISVTTEDIDFSKLTFSNTLFEAKLIIPSGCRNIDETDSVKVQFDLSGMSSKQLDITNFNVIGQSAENKVVSQKSVRVTVIGPKDQISSIKAENITGVVDMSKSNATSSQYSEETLRFDINSKFLDCWVHGSYKVDVVTKASDETSDESSSE